MRQPHPAEDLRTYMEVTCQIFMRSLILRAISLTTRVLWNVWIAMASPFASLFARVYSLAPHDFAAKYPQCFKSVIPASNINYSGTPPSDCDTVHFPEFHRPFSINPAYIVTLTNGQIAGDSATCLSSDGSIVPDSYPGRKSGKLSIKRIKCSMLLPPNTVASLCSLIDPTGGNYFHWFVDVLPRLRELEIFEKDTALVADLLVPGWMAPWQEESLRRMAPDRRWILHKPRNGLYRIKAETLLVPSTARFNGGDGAPFAAMDPEICRWLHDRIHQALNISVTTPRKRLFINRAAASSRRIVNERELVNGLEPLGFEVCALESLSFAEQVELFANASHIVAPHGAGLTNLLFSNNACVIELFSSGHGIRSDYYQICLALDHRYRGLSFESINIFNDFIVDVSLVIGFIDSTIQSPESTSATHY